jgi:hypothetical protein
LDEKQTAKETVRGMSIVSGAAAAERDRGEAGAALFVSNRMSIDTASWKKIYVM